MLTMRDQLCLCGCGSNAASSSRASLRSKSSSTRIASRSQTTPCPPTSRASGTPNPDFGRPCIAQVDRQSPLPAWADVCHCDQFQPRLSSRRSTRPQRQKIIVLPLLITLLCACFTTLVTAAASPAAATSPSVTTSLTLASNTATQVVPTAAPYQSSSEADGQKQFAAINTNAAAAAATAPANHIINVEASQPIMCESMNITFDPSRGSPPYTLMITIEDYWPVIVSLPASYDDPTKDLWLYQYPVPLFTGNTTNPSMIVTVTDSTGLMSNSSSFVQALSPQNFATCAPFDYFGSWYFYTERPPSMCQDYEIFWNGSYAPPMSAIFLPEASPPLYVAGPTGAANNMTWQVAMPGGTRFLMTMADSRATNGNGGVSKLNIVALNEYVSDSCVEQANYAHKIFAPTTTAARASIFPDAISTVASLTTNGGQVATVTIVETIVNGRRVNNKSGGGGLSGIGFLILMIVVFAGIGLGGAAVGWFCFRRRQKRKQNIRAWDLPNSDPSVPFSADPNMPIAPGIFGRTSTRNDPSTGSAREIRAADRSSVSGNYDPISHTLQPLTHAPSNRASLRSWTSSAFEHLHFATTTHNGRPPNASTNDYAMMNAAASGRGAPSSRSARPTTAGNASDASRDAWSPTDSVSRAFGFYTDDPQTQESAAYHEMQVHNRNGSPRTASRTTSSDGASSTKSMGVGPGATYRPDAASQAAYQDLLSNTASPISGEERNLPSSAARTQTPGSTVSPTSRTQGWAEVLEGTNRSTRVVRHADAGLLLDDNDNGDELINLRSGRLMELPPQYDTIHPSTMSQQRPLHGQVPSLNENPFVSPIARTPRTHNHGLASVDISDAGNRSAEVHAADLVDENDDESAFWAH